LLRDKQALAVAAIVGLIVSFSILCLSARQLVGKPSIDLEVHRSFSQIPTIDLNAFLDKCCLVMCGSVRPSKLSVSDDQKLATYRQA